MKHRNKKFPKSSFSRAYLFLLPSLIGVLVLFVIPYLDVILCQEQFVKEFCLERIMKWMIQCLKKLYMDVV